MKYCSVKSEPCWLKKKKRLKKNPKKTTQAFARGLRWLSLGAARRTPLITRRVGTARKLVTHVVMKGFGFARVFASVSPFGGGAVEVPKHAAWRRKKSKRRGHLLTRARGAGGRDIRGMPTARSRGASRAKPPRRASTPHGSEDIGRFGVFSGVLGVMLTHAITGGFAPPWASGQPGGEGGVPFLFLPLPLVLTTTRSAGNRGVLPA